MSSVIDLAQLRRGCAQCSLQQLCLPAGIAPADVARLDEIVKRRRPVERGERLFRPGDRLQAVYVARDGAFKTVATNEQGEEQVLGFHLPGELMGLDALGGGAHHCEAVALTTANVCEVPFQDLTRVANLLPSLQAQLLRVIGQSADRDRDHMGMLVKRQAGERIALFLHGLRERLRNLAHGGDGHAGNAHAGNAHGGDAHGGDAMLRLPMSREDIAGFLGLALETVSRGFGRLQEDGVIEVHGRRVLILDAAELARLAHGQDPTPPRQRMAR